MSQGAPWTVGDAQAFLKAGTLGSQMNFIQADPVDFLTGSSQVYDYVVLNNCLWYFDSPTRISDLLASLITKKHAKRVLIAEWSLEARDMHQVPHVLAALARANLEHLNKASTQNIRTAVSPAWFKQWFTERGVEIIQETLIRPPKSMQDGVWETQTVLHKSFVDDIQKFAEGESQRVALQASRDAVISAVSQLPNGGKDVQCMMIWAATV